MDDRACIHVMRVLSVGKCVYVAPAAAPSFLHAAPLIAAAGA